MKKKWIAVLATLFAVSFMGVVMAAECNCVNKAPECKGEVKSKAVIFNVESVELSEAGDYITVFDSRLDLFATISADVCKDYQSIKSGTKLRLWYDIMTMSLPARTNAVKVKILKK